MGRHAEPAIDGPDRRIGAPASSRAAGRHTAPIPTAAGDRPRSTVGRHTAAIPVQPAAAADELRAAIDRAAALGRPVAGRPVADARGLAGPLLPVAQTPRPPGAPLLPAQPPAPFAPRAARGTPAALPPTGPLPVIGAPSLSTAPIAVQRAPERRSRPVGRWVAVVAGLVVAGSVAAQVTAQRSVAEPVPGTSTSADPSTTGPTAASASPSASTVTASSGGAPASSGGAAMSFGSLPLGPASTPADGSSGPAAEAPGSTGTGTAGHSSSASTTPTETSSSVGPGSAGPSSSTASSSTASSSASSSASTTPTGSASSTPSSSAPSSSAPSSSVPSSSGPVGDAGTVRSLRAAVSSAGGSDVDLGTGTWRFDDFRDDLIGAQVSGSLTGDGVDRTVVAMTPRSSSRRSAVPKKDWTTNQLSLVKVTGATEIGGFTLRGTEQGHLYNGLRISASAHARVHDLKVESVPGNDDIPPGETFGINDFHTSGSRYSDVEVDGNGVASADFGTNSSSDVTISDSWFHDSGHANGATFWQTRDVTVRDTRSTGNYDAGFNFERVSGDVLLDHVTMKGNRLAHIRIDSDKGSADYRIVDPVFDGPKLKILMTPRYMGSPNLQQRSDVHVVIGGVDRTDDVVQWVTHF